MQYARMVVTMGILALAMAGCTEEAPTAGLIDEGIPERSIVEQASGAPGVLLRGPSLRPMGEGMFTSPLFGLATAPNGDVLVADAGAGIANRYGVTEIALPGVTDIGPIGRGSMWATTAGTDTEANSGQALYRVSQGKSRRIADLFAFEEANNPDGSVDPAADSNPYDVASLGGQAALVVDAGGNDLLRVNNRGNIELLAVFPPALGSTANLKALAGCPGSGAPFCEFPDELPTQAVPTSVVVGPDGYYYVGELKGFPAPTNESRVWRVSPDASHAICGSSPDCVEVFDGGFTSIIDLAFGSDGRLYVTELDEASWASVEIFDAVTGGTINACDLGTLACEEIATGIPILTAITFGRGGSLWATENALIPGAASVIQVP